MSDLMNGRRRVAVYSGSFNPIHRGHVAILQYLVDELGFDNVYLIVSPKNPLKENISEESGRQRYEDVLSIVRRLGLAKVKVDDIELNMPAPHYTIRTLDALKEREPDCDFTFVIGADNLCQLERWRSYERILKEFGVVVFPRKGYDMEAQKQKLEDVDNAFRIVLTDMPMVDISSTQIRETGIGGLDLESLNSGETDLRDRNSNDK